MGICGFQRFYVLRSFDTEGGRLTVHWQILLFKKDESLMCLLILHWKERGDVNCNWYEILKASSLMITAILDNNQFSLTLLKGVEINSVFVNKNVTLN